MLSVTFAVLMLAAPLVSFALVVWDIVQHENFSLREGLMAASTRLWALLTIGLGHVAVAQARRRGARAPLAAIAGLGLGYAGLLVLVLGAYRVVSTAAPP